MGKIDGQKQLAQLREQEKARTQAKASAESHVMVYRSKAGQEIKLSPGIVRKYLTTSKTVTDQEIVMYMMLARHHGLDPFIRECYLVKYGNGAASMIVSKDAFTKRAAATPECEGWQAGVVVQCADADLDYREGALVLSEENLVGGWAAVARKGWREPLKIAVSMEEYAKKESPTWQAMPATMIRKVALVQALREAFPDQFGGLYIAEEFGHSEGELPAGTVEIPKEEEPSPKAEPKVAEKVEPAEPEHDEPEASPPESEPDTADVPFEDDALPETATKPAKEPELPLEGGRKKIKGTDDIY